MERPDLCFGVRTKSVSLLVTFTKNTETLIRREDNECMEISRQSCSRWSHREGEHKGGKQGEGEAGRGRGTGVCSYCSLIVLHGSTKSHSLKKQRAETEGEKHNLTPTTGDDAKGELQTFGLFTVVLHVMFVCHCLFTAAVNALVCTAELNLICWCVHTECMCASPHYQLKVKGHNQRDEERV